MRDWVLKVDDVKYDFQGEIRISLLRLPHASIYTTLHVTKVNKRLLTLEPPMQKDNIFVGKKLKCKIQEKVNNSNRVYTKLLLIHFLKRHSSI